MARNLKIRIVTAVILLLASYGYTQTGFRIKTVSRTSGGRHFMDASDEISTAYVQGTNRRFDWPRSPSFATEPEEEIVMIQRCADHVMYQLNLKNHEYSEFPMPATPPKQMNEVLSRAEGPPNLIIEVTVRDTGETKSAFGHTARHYIKTTKQTASPELGMEPGETVEDVWYVQDLPDPRTCEPHPRRHAGLVAAGVGLAGTGPAEALAKIRPEFKYSGPDLQGLMLSSKRTEKAIHVLQTGERQETQFTVSNEIVELSEESVDPSLFEIPPGFKKVNQLNH